MGGLDHLNLQGQGVARAGLSPEPRLVNTGEKGDFPLVFRQAKGADRAGLRQHLNSQDAGLYRFLGNGP